jgi:hypothetical protein
VKEKTERVFDTYYDDDKSSIENAGWSFRIRKHPDRYTATLKSLNNSADAAMMKREEMEIGMNEQDKEILVSNQKKFETLFASSEIKLVSKLKVGINVINDRSKIVFVVNEKSEWEFCYDRFYYYCESDRRYSPYFCEIEIEKSLPSDDDDSDIAEFTNSLKELFDLHESKISKSTRGKEFIKAEYPPIINIMTIGFDIVGYSLLSPQDQLTAIQKMNKFAKDILKMILVNDCPICIPTGDGMYVILEKNHDITIPFIIKVQNEVIDYNRNNPSRKFSFRTGIHFGPVFKYSDINENLNYSGNGINMAARALNIGSEWHIICTEPAKEQLIIHGNRKEIFHPIGERKVKHEVCLFVNNIYEDNSYGNPIDP